MKFLAIYIAICFAGTTALFITALDPSGVANAQGFTNQSFKGKYAAKMIYGDNEGAGVGVMNADGNGNASGAYTLNIPGFMMQRNILSATVEGTYEVKSEGTCSLAFTIKLPNDMTINEGGECVIMQADDTKLAAEVFCMVNEPLTTLLGFKRGGIITMTFSRLPE